MVHLKGLGDEEFNLKLNAKVLPEDIERAESNNLDDDSYASFVHAAALVNLVNEALEELT